MNYNPSAAGAFDSVQYIMRDVEWGWLIRYMHSTGASLFFVVVFLHMFRGIIYGSYKRPRELVWLLGMLIFLALMAEAFMGYVLPWGNMSFWGAKVIIRSEEHTSELQSLMRISYAVFCLNKKTNHTETQHLTKSKHDNN